MKEEYALIREMLGARSRFGLTQEVVAELMGTTKSAVPRLESAGKHVPSLTTLRKYAQAVGCRLEIKLVPNSCLTKRSTRTAKKQAVPCPAQRLHEYTGWHGQTEFVHVC
ncbi:MAG: helix-turn-helix domain-containing protein [Candidatus Brocadia sp.]|nr:helix-turn-helix domain-containing protein [Candidatus Brocadia sp.]